MERYRVGMEIIEEGEGVEDLVRKSEV